MTKTSKKFLSVLLAAVMLVLCFVPAVAAANEPCEYVPTIIIPGFLQSDTHLYNDDGTLALDKDGNPYKAPFFLDTTSEIVFKALKNAFFPLMAMIMTQSDRNDRFANALAATVGDILVEKIRSDSNGKTVHKVEAEHYNYSFAQCTDEEKAKILKEIPISDLMEVIGEDHLYFYTYNSFGNLDEITKGLYDFIQLAKKETGHDKVNIVPISQGGTLCNNLLEYYPDVMNDLHRIVYAVPALDGTELMSKIFKNGINDADDALYGYMMPSLLGEETGALVNVLIRILPKAALKNAIHVTVEHLMNYFIKNCTCLWAFVTAEDYPELAERYLSGEENAVIRAQTDAYQQARVNSDANILKAIENGVEVFNISNYNYPLYTISDAWDDVNADGIIDLNSTGMGTYSLGVDKTLPEGYVQQGNSFGTCADPENHNHIDPHNLIDASTSLLPDHTFYYYNGDHEHTGSDDALIGLVERLLIDDSFKDVYSYPDEFPQFNNARNTKGLKYDLKTAKGMLATLSEEDAAALSAVIEEAELMLSHTKVDLDETKTAKDDFYEVFDRIRGKEQKSDSFFTKMFNKFVVSLSEKVQKKYGYNSFSGK